LPASSAVAGELTSSIYTSSTVQAWIRQTLVDLFVTENSCEARLAVAFERIDLICAIYGSCNATWV